MYKIVTNITGYKFILKTDSNLSIPFAEENTDYQTYLAWVAEGNIAEEVNN
jgi:hypothetical protein